MEMHSQECWLPADNGACVAAMTLKSQKTRPFPGFPIIKSARHCGKITIFLKKRAFYGYGFRSGGMYMYICVCAFYISYIRSSLLDIWCSILGCRARQVPCCCVTRAWPISDARWGDQFISISRIYMMIYDDIWCIMYFDYIIYIIYIIIYIYIGRYIWLNVIWDIDMYVRVCVCVTAGIPLFLRHQQEPT